jgi:hypothetical protein
MLSRRRIAFSHVIYTSGFFFLTVAFALIAVVALANAALCRGAAGA